MAEIGHNSGIDVTKLREMRDRIMNLTRARDKIREDAKTYTEDIKDVYAEAKASGFDVQVLRNAVKLAQLDAGTRERLGEYCDALGVFG